MIDFIVNYRLEILAVLVVIEILLSLLQFFLYKKAKKLSLNQDDKIQVIIDDCLDYYIKLAEVSTTGAREKLFFVVSHVIQRIKHLFPAADDDYWRQKIVDRVESTLSTPQKKG